jgi:hypothetical protein
MYHANQLLRAQAAAAAVAAAADGTRAGTLSPRAAPLSGPALTDYAALASTLGAEAASRIRQLKRYRESHNEVERRRRDNINQVIGELAMMVPDCYPGQSKGSILRKTAEFLRSLHRQGIISTKKSPVWADTPAAAAAGGAPTSVAATVDTDDDHDDDEDGGGGDDDDDGEDGAGAEAPARPRKRTDPAAKRAKGPTPDAAVKARALVPPTAPAAVA